MKKYRSPLQVFGAILFVLSIITFAISLLLCCIGKDSGIIPLFISLLLMFIAYKTFIAGKYNTERHYGAKYKRYEDENIYKDTQKKD